MIDEYGIFNLIGDTINQIYVKLDTIQFFGISIMAMMMSSFVISIIIPFLGIIVMPSIGKGGWSSRGGNDKRGKAEEPAKEGTARFAVENRARMQNKD